MTMSLTYAKPSGLTATVPTLCDTTSWTRPAPASGKASAPARRGRRVRGPGAHAPAPVRAGLRRRPRHLSHVGPAQRHPGRPADEQDASQPAPGEPGLGERLLGERPRAIEQGECHRLELD